MVIRQSFLLASLLQGGDYRQVMGFISFGALYNSHIIPKD